MSRRERMERRAAKRQEWAESAQRKAGQKFDAADRAVEGIPFGQPILVGHHSERRHRRALERCQDNMRAGIELNEKAERHEQIASTLADRLETTIFSDDDNAIQALETRIAEREAKRDQIKAYNVSCRKGQRDFGLLDEEQRAEIESIAKHAPYQLRAGGAMPAYVLSNLSGNIKADRDRIASIRRQAERRQEAERQGGMFIVRRPECFGYQFCSVTFAEKPAREIIDALKAAGFSWGAGSWGGHVNKLPQCVLDLELGNRAPETVPPLADRTCNCAPGECPCSAGECEVYS